MFASSLEPRAKRRGIVLVVVLGMLGLMALIGVTFATFAGQSLIASRNFGQGVARPQAEALMDYALAQLINDTNNPVSAIRGHSLLRDMYGNDSVFRGSNPTANPASETGGTLSSVFIAGVGTQTLHFTNYQQRTSGNNAGTTAFYNQIEYQTNIPTSGQYYGLDFTRWIVRFPNNGSNFPTNGVPQSFEVLEDDASGTFHAFTLASNLINQTIDRNSNTDATTSGDWTPFIYNDPNQGATVSNGTASKGYNSLAKEISPSNNTFPPNYVGLSSNSPSAPFTLYGQYMRAFNGAGLTQTASRVVNNTLIDAYPYNFAAYGNFRLNGLDPDGIGMDEDYDACDLENWFLAIQSADGQVVIPSYHRPGILMSTDWTSNNALVASKILRPRQADNSPLFPADPSLPDTMTGKLTYDIDNDGDGVTDSVWVDLGYPVQRDPVGKIYKPLFAFMVLGLNGRLPLNTVGNLQARAIGDRSNTSSIGTGETYPSGAQPGPSSLNSPMAKADATTQVSYPGPLTGQMAPDSQYFQGSFSSQVYLDAPLWDHTSHLGYSANEINPKYALQNAPSNLYANTSVGATSGSIFGVYPQDYTSITAPSYTQYDNVGVSVALTQMRNILAGTIPTDASNPLAKANLYPNSSGYLNPNTLSPTQKNQELNVAIVNGQPWLLPNNVADLGDLNGGTNGVQRTLAAVAGRWGEVSGVPQLLIPPIAANDTNNPALYSGGNQPLIYPMYWYNNPVRAGRSFFSLGVNDAMDDDFDAFDPYLGSAAQSNATYSLEASINSGTATQYQIPLNATGYMANQTFSRTYPEFLDTFDGAGQMAVASERSRRFTRPIDVAGVGRQGIFQNSGADGLPLNRPLNDNDYGNGFDKRGRVRSFRYFRPAGMPQEIRYPYDNSLRYVYPYVTNSGLGQQYLMPVLVPAGQSGFSGPASAPDLSNNIYSGYQAALTQYISNANVAQYIAPMGSMPYDWDVNNTNNAFNGTPSGGPPLGYGYTVNAMGQTPGITLLAPTISPSGALLSSINSDWGPKLTGVSTGYFINYGNLTGNSGQPAGDVVNGYVGSVYHNLNTAAAYIGGGSLNVDEADEMNLYASNLYDQPYGPSDLEWLYRLQDVDGSTLSSRLAKLAPVSFLNPSDGLTRRRLFSTDSWELNRFAYANDNPNGNFNFNSRFLPNASPSLENMNQVVAGNLNVAGVNGFNPAFANPIATEFLPNPTIPPTQNSNTNNNNISLLIPNASHYGSGTTLPQPLTPQSNNSLFTNAFVTATTNNGVIVPFGNPSTLQVQTPSIAHGDRKINLNFPLPIANDPAEPIRQKWCRETYQLLKAILPPASIDTPEELAALSQFVVNIVDFRDTDCTMTRFVNTDLEVTDVLTRTADNIQHAGTLMDPYDKTWSVSPSGVRFATTSIPAGHFPYDPSIYSPDGDPANHNAPTPFLVQHGMENNPIAINEAMAYEAQYGASTPTNPTPPLTTYQAMFIELVNTLTPEMNNPTSVTTDVVNHLIPNSSAISLAGWDILLTPDNYGWGRPDPITGDINPIALPRYMPDLAGSLTMPPLASKLQNATTSDMTLQQLQMAVQQYSFPAYPRGTANQMLSALYEYGQPDFYIIGDYRAGGASLVDITQPTLITGIEGASPVATATDINAPLPQTFVIPTPAAGSAQYYWIHLRRPANPFDINAPNQVRPNKEMVVVDSMRFPVINVAVESLTGDPAMPTLNPAMPVNAIYSAQRLQPYRGGHLLRVDTPVTPASSLPTTGAASGTTTIAPPNPPYAYGYSEQMGTPPAGNGKAQYKTGNTTLYTTKTFQQSINDPNRGAGGADSDWGHIPFNDRDFASVAELLLVPGCPPGLFTKQFIEEPYPGNIFSDAAMTTAATGTDSRNFASPILAPPFVTATTKDYSHVGNPNFFNPNYATPVGVPSHPTYPYLSDNFYYSAASVTPPSPGNSLDLGYSHLTTEIGGWTGAGWHKMLEFFEVPSSANGAIGTANNGNNYDWARSDLKPGLLNLNLIIDEEVFAGLVDDPRLNENLAYVSSSIPAVVTQIDSNGYPVFDNNQNSNTYGKVYGAQPMFSSGSVNPLYVAANSAFKYPIFPAGRGYSLRDPDVNHYPGLINATSFPPQQLHGMKAAFADFLKLRHGGSGYLFAYGNGPTGSGDYPVPTATNANGTVYPVVQGYPYLVVPRTQPTQPVAAERPYRSLSYPDINMTIMRPASLPPSPVNSSNGTVITPGTTPPIPIVTSNYSTQLPDGTTLTAGLENLGLYSGVTGSPYVQLEPARAPMAQKNTMTNPNGVNFQYVFDPGVKNPYLPIQFVNQDSPANNPTGSVHLAPPYATPLYTGVAPATVTPAPFPPQIPPVPAARLFQIPDFTPTFTQQSAGYASGASLLGQYNVAYLQYQVNATITDDQLAMLYTVNQQTVPQQLSTGIGAGTQTPPTLVASSRAVFLPDNVTPQPNSTVSNYLGSTANNDFRQHPLYRTEMLQKVMNLTTVRTHQFAVWITVGFFEVVKPGTTELGIPDSLGQELGLTAGKNVRYRSFFTLDRTRATGFNPYYPGNFRDVVTYRRRIE